MLSDRSYMRADPNRSSASVLVWLLGGIIGVFVVQNVFTIWFGSNLPLSWGGLSSTGIRAGKIWTLLTYALLHGGIGHLLINCLGVFFIGRELQNALSPVRFLQLVLIGTLGASLFWLGVNFQRPGNVIGASGLVMALLTVFACLYPRRQMTMLLFFVIPVTIQPVWLVTILGSIDLLGFLFYELPSNRSLYDVAHSAHLGGLASGWLFYQFAIQNASGKGRAAIEPPAWLRRKPAKSTVAYRVNVESSPGAPSSSRPLDRDALRAEVDRILDKINLNGFASLTAEEKRVLDDARHHLNPR
ncbi:MAG: rhomboid family intramembrane serine protease [Verrucomicrobia bacterium]|nr:rhomboid family intramembrane serine protease [Verrucomicrobiota bacterium]